MDSSSRIVSRAGNVLLDGGGLAVAFGVDGSKVDISWPEYINESFISNCPQAFYGVGMEFFTMFPITFTNVPLIAQCSAGTKLVMSNEVTIVNSNADPIILDDSSSFVAPYSTPFPNDIYTYAGSGVMNSAFNIQVIDSVGSATITMPTPVLSIQKLLHFYNRAYTHMLAKHTNLQYYRRASYVAISSSG